MLPSRVVTALDAAISRAQARLLALQAPNGHWAGEVEAPPEITAEYVLLCHLLDRVDRERERKAVRFLRRKQRADGGWNLFEEGPTNLSATIKLFPRVSPFNIYEVSYWSRTVIVPLLILMDRKPVTFLPGEFSLDELL